MPVVLLKSALNTVGRVEGAGGVEIERINAGGRVHVAGGGVVRERIAHRWPCCNRR